MATDKQMTDAELANESPWKFACDWYRPDEIARSIATIRDPCTGEMQEIPTDVGSREFAEWLTEQYRLAMAKGIDVGKRAARLRDKERGEVLQKVSAGDYLWTVEDGREQWCTSCAAYRKSYCEVKSEHLAEIHCCVCQRALGSHPVAGQTKSAAALRQQPADDDPDLRCQDNDAGTLMRAADEIRQRLPGPVGESFAETLEKIADRAVPAGVPRKVVEIEDGELYLCFSVSRSIGFYTAWRHSGTDEWRCPSPRQDNGYIVAPKPDECFSLAPYLEKQ